MRTCVVCGSEFAAKRRSEYCSAKCYHKIYRLQRTEYYRAYYASENATQRARRKASHFASEIRHLPESAKIARRVLLELTRWCKANGYGGYRKFLKASLKESAV